MTRHKDSDPLQFKSDERQLWAAVIMQQIEDATSIFVPGSRNQRESDLLCSEAREWLTIPNDDFDDACFLAGLEPEWVRKGAIQKIEEFDRKHDASPPARLRRRRLYTHKGQTHSLKEWAEITGLSAGTIYSRLYLGLSLEDALTRPVGAHKRNGKSSPFGFDNIGRTLPV